MIPRKAGRAIVIKDNHILLMKRQIGDQKYLVTPGGRIEAGETAEQAAIREVEEETMVKIANPRLVFEEEPNNGRHGTQYIFLCDYVSGEPILNPLSEEFAQQDLGLAMYEPVWIAFEDLPLDEYPFLSERLGVELFKSLESGFPSAPLKWAL